MTTISKEIQNLLTLNDRGNTILFIESNLGFFAQVTENQWFCVEYRPDNYPTLYTFFMEGSKEEIREKVREAYPMYYCSKNNLGLPLNSNDQVIPAEDEM